MGGGSKSDERPELRRTQAHRGKATCTSRSWPARRRDTPPERAKRVIPIFPLQVRSPYPALVARERWEELRVTQLRRKVEEAAARGAEAVQAQSKPATSQ